MKKDAKTAFLSYSRENSDFAIRLARDLKTLGAKVWLDALDVLPGQRWDRTVENALLGCQCMLVILSPSSVNSMNVMDEVHFALSEQKIIIPILFRDCEVPFLLRHLQFVDFRDDYERAVKTLLGVLAQQPLDEALTVPSATPRETPPDISNVATKRLVEPGRVDNERLTTKDTRASREPGTSGVKPDRNRGTPQNVKRLK